MGVDHVRNVRSNEDQKKKEEKRGVKEQDPPNPPPPKITSSGCLLKIGECRFRTLVSIIDQ